MTYLTYGDVHHRANALGLIMSRDRMTLRISLRYRDPANGRQVWRNMTLQEVLTVIESMEGPTTPPQRTIPSAPERAYHRA